MIAESLPSTAGFRARWVLALSLCAGCTTTQTSGECVARSDCATGFSCVDGTCAEMLHWTDAGMLGRDAGQNPETEATDAGMSPDRWVRDGGPGPDDGGRADSRPPELEPVDFDVLSEIRVTADGPGGRDTYALFWDGFGQGSVEAPDLYSNNHSRGRHITEFVGGPTGHFFRFAMHRDLDRDRDRYPDIDDRQRNEIKTFARSPEAGKGRPGETVRYHWYFRIPTSYATGRRFNHVMQVKAAGGNDGSPPLTISAARRRGEAQLQARYMSETGRSSISPRRPLVLRLASGSRPM